MQKSFNYSAAESLEISAVTGLFELHFSEYCRTDVLSSKITVGQSDQPKEPSQPDVPRDPICRSPRELSHHTSVQLRVSSNQGPPSSSRSNHKICIVNPVCCPMAPCSAIAIGHRPCKAVAATGAVTICWSQGLCEAERLAG